MRQVYLWPISSFLDLDRRKNTPWQGESSVNLWDSFLLLDGNVETKFFRVDECDLGDNVDLLDERVSNWLLEVQHVSSDLRSEGLTVEVQDVVFAKVYYDCKSSCSDLGVLMDCPRGCESADTVVISSKEYLMRLWNYFRIVFLLVNQVIEPWAQYRKSSNDWLLSKLTVGQQIEDWCAKRSVHVLYHSYEPLIDGAG